MPNRIESVAVSDGDQTWLASTHGTDHATTGKLLKSAFTPATYAPNGFLPSGTALALNGAGEYVPYDQAAADGTEVLRGFLLTDQPLVVGSADTHINGPVLYHGRVRKSRLPLAFTEPAAGKNATTITFEA